MYNEFAPKHYKGKWPCTTKTLYNEKTLTGRLHKYFLIYFETFSAPTADTLFLLVLSILTLESVHSIRFLYQHFLSGITTKSLNTFYHACSYAKVDYSHFMNITAKVALRMIPDSLATQPIFLCVDDTMVAKAGTRFENVSKLFDHAAHNGSNYLNGHCFVSIMLCMPVWKNDRVSYLSLPLGYRMRQNRSTPCDHQPFWMSGNSGLCDRYWKRTRYKTPVFQHHFPGRLADFLCLAGKRTIKPDRKWQDEIYSAVFVLVPVEYWNKLLWAENLLVTLQLYGTKLQGYWNAGKSDQYLLLCNEDLTLSGWAVFRIPYKKCTGVSFWIKSGHSQPDIFDQFR